jgi:hypothetical protein
MTVPALLLVGAGMHDAFEVAQRYSVRLIRY